MDKITPKILDYITFSVIKLFCLLGNLELLNSLDLAK